MLDKYYVGLDLTSSSNNGKYKPVSRVTLLLDDNEAITAGDDSGLEIVANCPYATQGMVNALLAQWKGYQYQASEADDANLNPSAELGDGMTAGGIYSPISRVRDDGSGFSLISSPGRAELEDEYPMDGPLTRMFNRAIVGVRSSITKTASEIRSEVKDATDGLSTSIAQTAKDIRAELYDEKTGKFTKLQATVDGLNFDINDKETGKFAKLQATVDGLNFDINDKETGKFAKLSTTADKINWLIESGTNSSDFTLTERAISLAAGKIDLTGFVTFKGLEDGTTSVNGGCIDTGKISAEYLELEGAITFDDLGEDAQEVISNIAEEAGDAKDIVDAWSYAYGDETYINGRMLMAGTVMASKLLGGYVGLLDYQERKVGGISITRTETDYGVEISTEYGGIRMNSAGNWWVDASDGSMGITSSGIVCSVPPVPESSGNVSLGTYGFKWSDVYTSHGKFSELVNAVKALESRITALEAKG